jgi:hypothetical protein
MRVLEVLHSIQDWLSRPPVDPHCDKDAELDKSVDDAVARLKYERRVLRELGDHLKGRRENHEPV